MSIWISRYELQSAMGLGARTERRIYPGALIRVGEGFGCLHPWPELGDPTLEECLEDLKGPRKSRLVQRALYCADIDGKAREEGVSLFEGVVVPKSHFLMVGISEEGLEEAAERGFSVVKVKAGRMVRDEMEKIRHLSSRWPNIRWRIDFNELANCEELRGILSRWEREELKRIDFVEDPSPFRPGDWAELPVSVANDREMARDRGTSEVLVIKPAIEEIPSASSQRVVVTSYLDHPIGQCFAAYEAGKSGISEICGLQSHGVFVANPFSEELGELSPVFRPPVEKGLGFSDLLGGLDWVKS
ncbi:MAG: hypothetical protein P8H96_02070 [Akkermansiaceae bacterium]|nr:hypothetical protein [Akkermansiaceae bacterium]